MISRRQLFAMALAAPFVPRVTPPPVVEPFKEFVSACVAATRYARKLDREIVYQVGEPIISPRGLANLRSERFQDVGPNLREWSKANHHHALNS